MIQPYTNEQLDALLRACIEFADTFQEESFYSGNIAGREGVVADSLAVQRMLEWVAEQDKGLLVNRGFGNDNITYFRLGLDARHVVNTGGFGAYFRNKSRKRVSTAPLPDDVLFLSLSGGGLRATIFHLGVFLFLSEARRLEKVNGIVSVSGGSILAAHLVNRWHEATLSQDHFDRVAADLIAFTRTDIRHTVFIPWLWARLVPINWWRRNQSLTARLRATYDKHFQGQTLGGLDNNKHPFLAMVATDSIKQERIAFTPTEFSGSRLLRERAMERRHNLLRMGQSQAVCLSPWPSPLRLASHRYSRACVLRTTIWD